MTYVAKHVRLIVLWFFNTLNLGILSRVFSLFKSGNILESPLLIPCLLLPFQVKKYPGYNFVGLIYGSGGDNQRHLEKVKSE